MSEFGTITARVFTSSSMLPIEGAAVLFYRKTTAGENELLGMRVTDFDGYTDPVSVPTPDADSTDVSSSGETPYAVLNVLTAQPGYNRILVRNAQVFTGVRTLQELRLVPTPALAEQFGRLDVYDIPPQEL